MSLPTADEMLANAEAELTRALAALGDAADWLRSDWRPVGSPLNREQATRRQRMMSKIEAAKRAINQAKGGK